MANRLPMGSLGKWLGIGAALGLMGAVFPLSSRNFGAENFSTSLSRLKPERVESQSFEGLNLTRVKLHPRRVSTPLPDGKTAILTLDPELQRSALNVMKRYRIPEAGAVLLDVQSGKTLLYASYVNKGEQFDVNARAEAPAASVFKVVTGAALVEMADLTAATEQCYRGGRSRITAGELDDDPARDKWCASLATAMGRSLNVVFARLARKHLSVEQLSEMAGALGFGAPVPFEARNEPSGIALPEDPLEFARASAGFWHTSLSPLAGATLAQTVANSGVTLRPYIVQKVVAGTEETYRAPTQPQLLRRALKPETARELTRMMVQTVSNGSAYKTFHDKRGRAYLPEIPVAGKTGTLTRHKENRHYTWFVGFAPADKPEVAVSALVVNTPVWRIKGPHLAREVLRAYFAKQGRNGVSRP